MTGGRLVAIEPVEQQDEAGRERKLQEIDPSGQLIYKQPKDASSKLTEKLHRVWQERGDFNLVSSEELAKDPEYAIKEVEQVGDSDDEAAADLDGKMTYEAMAKMRGELLQNLNMARNEIWLVFELARTLVAATNQAAAAAKSAAVESKPVKGKKNLDKSADVQPDATSTTSVPETTDGNPLLLPVGSITTSTSVNPYLPLPKQVRAIQLALATKRQAALSCADMFDDAVKQMNATYQRSESYWQNVQRLKNGENSRDQWSLMAKPAFGVHAKTNSMARDMAIPYALDEAGPSIRAQCLATFPTAPDSDKPLEYHARRHRRLRCQIITAGSRQASRDASTDETTASQSLAVAQKEIFDEEIYAEVVSEIRRAKLPDSMILKNSASIALGGGSTLAFSLYDTKEVSEPPEPPSSVCDAILASARLLMLNVYRYRKNRAYARPGQQQSQKIQPSIIQPIISILRFKQTATRLQAISESFIKCLQAADVTVQVQVVSSFAGVADWSEALERLNIDEDVGIAFVFVMEGCPAITVTSAPSDQVTVTVPQATFTIEDLVELPDILARQASRMVSERLLRSLQDGQATPSTGMFVDELDDRLIIGPYSVQLDMDILSSTVAATASNVTKSVEIKWQTGDQEGLEAWVRGLASEASA